MDKSKWVVHEGHCCKVHGCKYGDSDCPVTNGETKQNFICEDCDFEGIYSLSELKELEFLTREALLNKDKESTVEVSSDLLRALIFGENRSHIKFIEVDLSKEQKTIIPYIKDILKLENNQYIVNKKLFLNNFSDKGYLISELSDLDIRQVALYLTKGDN